MTRHLFPRPIRYYALVVAWGLVLGSLTVAALGCSTVADDAATSAPTSAEPVAWDPYAAYLASAPADAPPLTPDEAQGRALLGCGVSWAPGTVDAALSVAYKVLCDNYDITGQHPGWLEDLRAGRSL
jgi:hypothetical protein